VNHDLRAVIVGCGGISRAWLEPIADIAGLAMVGFVDINMDAAQARRDQYGWADAVISDDLEETLKATKPDIVFDCAIPEAHFDVTLQALAHGCHVLGEKPLADTMGNAQRMAEAAGQAGKTFAVMQNRRYDPNIRRLCEFIGLGAIGRVTTVNCDFYVGAHFGGFRDHMRHVLLLDMAIHTFDAARLITGSAFDTQSGDPTGVYCKEWNPAGSWYDHDASAVALFDMTGEVTYTYRGSWCAEGLRTTWESDWRVIGTEGSVRWDGSDGFQVQVVKKRGDFHSEMRDVELPLYEGPKTGGHGGCIRDFIRCIQTGETPETVCTDNIKSLAMVFGAIESAERRQYVSINAAGELK
jgi:predicted dehydrogenase